MTTAQIKEALSAPFAASDVEWRVQNVTQDKTRGLAVPYLDSRAIQNRLDAVVGPYNWKTEFKPWHQVQKKDKDDKTAEKVMVASQLCGLSVYNEERGEWVAKWDGAENSDIEPVKGGISDSFKRAAVLWGVGRYLYAMESCWVDVEQKGKSTLITAAGKKALDASYERAVKGGNVTPFPTAAAPATVLRSQTQSPSAPFHFDYTVQGMKQSDDGKFTAVNLCDKQGQSVLALIQGEDTKIAAGICLRNVKLTPRVGANNSSYNTLDSYEIAA